jgi:hypothetical protein
MTHEEIIQAFYPRRKAQTSHTTTIGKWKVTVNYVETPDWEARRAKVAQILARSLRRRPE